MAEAVAQLVASLEDADAIVRCQAVRALTNGAVAGDDEAVALLTKRTSDDDEDVREAAVKGILSVAHRGDTRALDGVLPCLEDVESCVRQAAVHAVAALAVQGRHDVVGQLLLCLVDEDSDVRSATLDAFGDLPEESKDNIMQQVIPWFNSNDSSKRTMAARVLVRIAEKGNETAVATLLGQVHDVDTRARYAAVRALGCLAEPGDRRAVKEFCGCLGIDSHSLGEKDEDEDIRCEALEALQTIALQGDKATLAAAAVGLADDCSEVRRAAVDTVAAMATGPHDSEALAVVRKTIASGDADTRCAALQALSSFARNLGDVAMLIVEQHLVDDSVEVRQAAVEAINAAVGTGHQRALQALLRCVSDPHEDVRQVAVEGISVIAPRGDHGALTAVEQALGDEDDDVKCAAATSIAAVALQGDTGAVDILSRLLPEQCEAVQVAFVNALLTMAESDSSTVWVALTGLLGNEDVAVRCAAAGGLSQILQPSHMNQFQVVETLAPLLEDGHVRVRDTAVAGMVAVASNSNTCDMKAATLAAATLKCEHDKPCVRMAALEVVVGVPHITGSSAAESMLHALEDPVAEVREAAFSLLEGMPPSSKEAHAESLISGCASRVMTRCRSAERAVVLAVSAVWPDGNLAVQEKALCCVVDNCPQIRKAGLECLAEAALPCFIPENGPGRNALMAIIRAMEDTDEGMRDTAVKAFQRLLQRNTGFSTLAALNALQSCLRHRSAEVRCSGLEAIAAANLKGDEVDSALLSLLDDGDEDVRWSALQALGQVSGRDNHAVLAAVCRCAASDPDEHVRAEAAGVLGQVSPKGHPQVLSLLERLLNDAAEVSSQAIRSMLALFPDTVAADSLSSSGLV